MPLGNHCDVISIVILGISLCRNFLKNSPAGFKSAVVSSNAHTFNFGLACVKSGILL